MIPLFQLFLHSFFELRYEGTKGVVRLAYSTKWIEGNESMSANNTVFLQWIAILPGTT